MGSCTLYFHGSGDLLSVDDNFEAMFGFKSREIGKRIEDTIIPTSQRPLYLTMMQGFIRTGMPKINDIFSSIELQDKSGRRFPVKVESTEHGQGEDTIFIVQLNKLNNCTITFDISGLIITCTNQTIFDYSEKDLKTVKVADLIPGLQPVKCGRDAKGSYEFLLDQNERNNLSKLTLLGKQKGGQTFSLRIQVDSWFGIGRMTIFCATLFRLCPNVQAAIRIDEFSSTILDCSSQVYLLFGYTREELVGKPLGTLIPGDQQQVWSPIGNRLVHVCCRSGSLIEANCSTIRLKAEEGGDRPVEYLMRFSVPERKQEEKIIGNYILQGLIAQGAFGVVKEAKNLHTNEMVAIKSIQKAVVFSENMNVSREIVLLKNLNHPNIVKLVESFETEDQIHIVMEHIKGQNLKTVLLTQNLKEDQVKLIFSQLVAPIMYCHEHGIFHRDIKPSNVLISNEGTIKLIDFGLSNFQYLDRMQSTCCGSPAFVSPEIILGKKYCGRKSDVWSLGVLLHTMVTRELPFRTVKEIVKGDIPLNPEIPPGCRELLVKMLQYNPEDRPSIHEIAQDPWLLSSPPNSAC